MSTKTTWILELIDKVTAPMKGVDKSTSGIQKTVNKVTAALDAMDNSAKATANQAIKSFNDLNRELKQEQAQIRKLQNHLKDLGKDIDPLLKAQIDLDIKQAQTKARRYKEQLVEVKHELEAIAKQPDQKKLKANWGAAVVVANQSVELINSAISGLSFTTEIEDLRVQLQQMTDETGPALDTLKDKVWNLGKTFKESPEEIARAANAMTKQIGGTYEENLALIESGFEKGANLNSDFLDQLKEYPTFIQQLGLTQSQAIALMAQAGKKGIFSDKAIDSIKEADLSLRELGQPQIDALKGIGLAVKDLAGKTTFEAVQMISKSMEGATTQAKQLVLADIFKGAGEDAGMGWIEGLNSVDLDINNIPSVEAAGSGIRSWLAGLQTSFSDTFGSIGASVVELSPVVTAMGAMIPLISSLSKVNWVQAAASKVATAAQWLWNAAMTANPIGIVIAAVAALVAGIVWLSTKVTGWGEAWKHTWSGAKLLFQAFVEGIKANWNTMINGLMIGINKIKEGWIKFKQYWGIGDSSENKKILDQINADTEARKKSIVDGYKKAAGLALEATGEFVQAGLSLKLKKDSETKSDKVTDLSSPECSKVALLDCKTNDTKNPAGGRKLQGSAKGIAKSIRMDLTINNHFNVADTVGHKIDKIADMVTGRVNDRLRDALLSV